MLNDNSNPYQIKIKRLGSFGTKIEKVNGRIQILGIRPWDTYN